MYKNGVSAGKDRRKTKEINKYWLRRDMSILLLLRDTREVQIQNMDIFCLHDGKWNYK